MFSILIANKGHLSIWDVLFIFAGYALLVLVVMPVHEFAHAWAAHLCGDDTAKWNGRMTINPMAHLTVPGVALLVLFGFGYARPVPVNTFNLRHGKRDFILVSLAGPLSNLLMAILSVGIFCVIASVSRSMTVIQMASLVFISILMRINITLAIFNLLPIPPLDGSRLWSSLLPTRWAMILEQYSQYFIIAVFVLLFTGVLDAPLNFLENAITLLIFRMFGLA